MSDIANKIEDALKEFNVHEATAAAVREQIFAIKSVEIRFDAPPSSQPQVYLLLGTSRVDLPYIEPVSIGPTLEKLGAEKEVHATGMGVSYTFC